MEELQVLNNDLSFARVTKNKELEWKLHNDIGVCCCSMGKYEKAKEHFEAHLAIGKEIGDKKVEGITYGNLGICYQSLTRYAKAIKCQEMRLTIAKDIGDKQGEGHAYGNLGSCYQSLGQYAKAIKYQEMQLTIAKETGDKQGEGSAYGNLGICYQFLGQYTKAIKYQEMRLTIAKETSDKQGEGHAYGNLGICYQFLGQYTKAIEYQEMLLFIAKDIGDKHGEGSAYINIGNSYTIVGHYERAENNLRKGMVCREELFKNSPNLDTCKVSIIDTFIHTYKKLILTLLLLEKRGKALIIAERGRSIALAELMLSSNSCEHEVVTGDKVSDLCGMCKVAKALESTVIFFTLLDDRVCTWVIQPNGDIMFHERDTGVSPQFRKTYTEMDLFQSAENLTSLINKAVELMKPFESDRCENFSNTDGSALQDETGISTSPQATIGPMLNCLLQELYEILLKPVRQYIVGSQVVIVPDGRLALVPFAALVDENRRYLVDSLRLRLVPSLRTAKMILEHPVAPTGLTTPLIVGDPKVGTIRKGDKVFNVERLEVAKKEAETVGAMLGVKPLLGKRVTKKRFLQNVENTILIHISAHADAKRGEILLAPPDTSIINNAEDIMLLTSDLEGKRIKAKLVVLSCSYSGCGEVRGEGVVGIARAFLGAGARAVIVTLWEIDDGATLCWMYRFYESLISGDSANEALNKACIATRKLKKFGHPCYWAPFALLGEDVTLFSKTGHYKI